MIIRNITLCYSLLGLIACNKIDNSYSTTEHWENHTHQDISYAAPEIGSISDEGNLIIHVFYSVDTPSVPLPVELKGDYGFMIFNDGDFDDPTLKVLISSRYDAIIQEADSWESVEQIISRIPEGVDIDFYGKCMTPTFYGLPGDTWERFMKILSDRNIAYDQEKDYVTCVCRQVSG